MGGQTTSCPTINPDNKTNNIYHLPQNSERQSKTNTTSIQLLTNATKFQQQALTKIHIEKIMFSLAIN